MSIPLKRAAMLSGSDDMIMSLRYGRGKGWATLSSKGSFLGIKFSKRMDSMYGDCASSWCICGMDGQDSESRPRRERWVRSRQLFQGTVMQSSERRRTRGRRISKNKADEVFGILRDKCIRFVKLPPMLEKRWAISSGKRNTSIECKRPAWRARLSVVNLSGEVQMIDRGASLERTRNWFA